MGRHSFMTGVITVFLLLVLRLVFSTSTETFAGYSWLDIFFQKQIEIVSTMGSSLTGLD